MKIFLSKNQKLLLLIISLTCLLFLSGCVSLVQEVTVREDGSGTLLFALGVETNVYPQFQETVADGLELENLLSSLILDENVSNVQQESYEAGGRIWESILFEMDDLVVVFEEGRSFGPLTLSITQNEGDYTFDQTLDLADSNVRFPGINLLDLTNAGYTVRLITPQILSSNGLQVAAGSSEWNVSLREMLQGGERIWIRADYVLEPYEGVFIPWETFYPYVINGFLALGFIAILVVVVVNTYGKREKERKLQF